MTAGCPPDDELDRLLADRLSPAEEAALEAHVAGCAACQARLDRLTGGPLPPPTPPAGPRSGFGPTSRPPGLLRRVADLPPADVRFLEHEFARSRGNGSGAPPPGDAAPPAGGPRFTPLRPHAEGGLGRVHLARDEQLRRTVALKEVRPELADDPRLRRRFLNEAEITGQLEHPGVVPIYALESDPAGRPVYAMRFVQGRTLGDAITAHHHAPTPLGLRELLQRFVSVCQTVAFAHSKGVIHRDLKPSNVMLGDYGETLVVDWGLAKRLGAPDGSAVAEPAGPPAAAAADGADGLARTVLAPPAAGSGGGSDQLTAAGTVMGTPAYMSPEQARGEPVAPAADVYSLGAMLFTLLTGKTPYQGTTAVEVLRKVAAGERPVAPGAPRPLNAIYFKAMARDPAARYATAGELARDVERWLADEPVTADREPWPARAGRWARRHRSLVASLGVAAVLLAAAGVGVAWWGARLAQERRFEQARAGEQVGALLDRAEAAVAADNGAAARQAVGDAEALAASPGADHLAGRLARCRAAADVLADLDRVDEVRWGTEGGKGQGNARAVKEWAGVFARIGVHPGQTPAAEAAAVVTGSLARERLVAALDIWLLGAARADRAALAAVLAAADPDPYRDDVRAAVVRQDVARLRALAARDEAVDQPPGFAAMLGSVAELPAARKRAVLGRAAQRKPRAFAVLMTAGGLYRSGTPTTAPDRISWYRGAVVVRPTSALARYSLGLALQDRGDWGAAVAEYRAALALDPKLAPARSNTGLALAAQGDPAGAVAEYRAALAVDPAFNEARINLGLALLGTGETGAAAAEFRAALARDPGSVNAHNNLGLALLRAGHAEAAAAEFRAAIALDPKQPPPHTNLGEALKHAGDLAGAAAAYREAARHIPAEPRYKQLLAEVERWPALRMRLDAVAAGKTPPATAAEAADFARLLRQPFVNRHAAAARLYAAACAKDPKYATDAGTFDRRSEAARSAALAGCGQGADAPADPAARAALRRQALTWLEANRRLLANQLASGTTVDRIAAANLLVAGLTERDLAGVRPGAARAGWEPGEAAAWDAYWAAIRAALKS